MEKDLFISVTNKITKCVANAIQTSKLFLGREYTTLRFLLAYALNNFKR